ncbi:MAG TPA: P1 family peptidase [Candidatus Limnocylindria bacterium]|nr:P1 family peptidase [Candidatus Limnocylindria bacterium]
MIDSTSFSLRDIPGLFAGHHTDASGGTGCTVILAPAGAVAGVDVRGSAPGTRETDLLRPTALVDRVNAVLLTGGSAFGLVAADGVMRWLAERGHGFATGVAPVPIVPAAVIFDLDVGSPDARPSADDGYAACEAAFAGAGNLAGRVGAGTGATVGKLLGPPAASPGGVGSAGLRLPDGSIVAALCVTNAFGNVVGREGRTIAGIRDGQGGFVDAASALLAAPTHHSPRAPGQNTTLAVVATDASLDRAQCHKLAEVAHDALALAISPVHTMLDGDTVFALSTGNGQPATIEQQLRLGVAAVEVLRTAIERSVAA